MFWLFFDYLCQHPLGTSSVSARSGLSSALISLLGDDGVVSDSDHAFALPDLLLAAVLGRLMAKAVEGLDFSVPGREDAIPDTDRLPGTPDAGLLRTPPEAGRLPGAPDKGQLLEGRLLLLGGRLTTG